MLTRHGLDVFGFVHEEGHVVGIQVVRNTIVVIIVIEVIGDAVPVGVLRLAIENSISVGVLILRVYSTKV